MNRDELANGEHLFAQLHVVIDIDRYGSVMVILVSNYNLCLAKAYSQTLDDLALQGQCPNFKHQVDIEHCYHMLSNAISLKVKHSSRRFN